MVTHCRLSLSFPYFVTVSQPSAYTYTAVYRLYYTTQPPPSFPTTAVALPLQHTRQIPRARLLPRARLPPLFLAVARTISLTAARPRRPYTRIHVCAESHSTIINAIHTATSHTAPASVRDEPIITLAIKKYTLLFSIIHVYYCVLLYIAILLLPCGICIHYATVYIKIS